jgi:hypothetical protein
MVRVVPITAIVAVACGGSPPPPPPKPVDPPKPHATRVPIEDSEQEDGVTIINAHGHMEPAAVEAGLAPHKTELFECYTKQVGRRRWLGGHVQLHWDIKADGTITSVKLSESDLGAWSIEKCLVEVARVATFDKPIGGSADFMIPLDFSTKGGTLAWDEDQGLKAVGGQLAKLDPCAKAETPPDDVTITLYVGPHGKAYSVGFSSAKTEIKDKWAECAEKAALAWRLPDPRGQVAKLAIRYRSR